MRLLVVGGAGYVGSLLRPALEREHECTHYDIRPVPGAGSKMIVADVNDDAQVGEAVRNIDCVVYLAMGSVNFDRQSVSDINAAFNVNVRGAYRFLNRALAAGVRRFVYASSLSVYNQFYRNDLMDEQTPADAWYPYGLTKRIGEFICAAAAQHEPEATIVGLRLMSPRNQTDWPASRYDPARKDNSCALGPQDTQRLFLAAIACQRPGWHLMQATGDIVGDHFSHERAETLLGWRPRNE